MIVRVDHRGHGEQTPGGGVRQGRDAGNDVPGDFDGLRWAADVTAQHGKSCNRGHDGFS